MSRLDQARKDLELERAKLRAALGKRRGPEAVLADLAGIDFAIGEKVYDSVTGAEVEVVATGIRNVTATE